MIIDTSALRAAAEGATPGPWEHVTRQGPSVVAPSGPVINEWNVCERNAAFIAAANPAVVLELLDELDRARTQFGIELRRSAAYAAELDRYLREGTPDTHNRHESDANAELAPEATRDAAGPSAGFRGDGVEAFLADDTRWGFIDPHGQRAERIRKEASDD